MKTILFTGFDAPYNELAKITVPRMADYALRHGMSLGTFDEPPSGLNIYWTGVARGLELLRQGYDRIMYLDVDQLITNMDKNMVPVPGTGFHCSKDWGEDATEPWHFSACGWIAHQDCIPMFEDVLAMEPEWRDKPFQEQGPWREWMRKQLKDLVMVDDHRSLRSGFIDILPRRSFNAVPDAVCPGKVPEPWTPDCWCAHITMVPIERRIEIAREILAKL